MDIKKMMLLRKQAESAVEDMEDGELKVKAFEVILSRLLGSSPTTSSECTSEGDGSQKTLLHARARKVTGRKTPTSLIDRVLILKEENYFTTPRSIGEVRKELQTHGWHYPVTTLSGSMLSLVQKRELRRQKDKTGWRYTNT